MWLLSDAAMILSLLTTTIRDVDVLTTLLDELVNVDEVVSALWTTTSGSDGREGPKLLQRKISDHD